MFLTVHFQGIEKSLSEVDRLTNYITGLDDLTSRRFNDFNEREDFFSQFLTHFWRLLMPAINSHLAKPINQQDILKASSNRTIKHSKEFSIMTIEFSNRSRIPYTSYPHKITYRDPSKASSDFGRSIHHGAHPLFPRYAITQVNVLGQNKSAGKRGSELEGIGWEPMGVIPKTSANRNDYKVFIRRFYPSRLRPESYPARPNKDITIKGSKVSHPVYVAFLEKPNLRDPIFDQLGNILHKKFDRRSDP